MKFCANVAKVVGASAVIVLCAWCSLQTATEHLASLGAVADNHTIRFAERFVTLDHDHKVTDGTLETADDVVNRMVAECASGAPCESVIATPPPLCAPGDLAAESGDVQAATGTRYLDIRVTNRSDTSCSMPHALPTVVMFAHGADLHVSNDVGSGMDAERMAASREFGDDGTILVLPAGGGLNVGVTWRGEGQSGADGDAATLRLSAIGDVPVSGLPSESFYDGYEGGTVRVSAWTARQGDAVITAETSAVTLGESGSLSADGLPQCAADDLFYTSATSASVHGTVIVGTVVNRGDGVCTVGRVAALRDAGLGDGASDGPLIRLVVGGDGSTLANNTGAVPVMPGDGVRYATVCSSGSLTADQWIEEHPKALAEPVIVLPTDEPPSCLAS